MYTHSNALLGVNFYQQYLAAAIMCRFLKVPVLKGIIHYNSKYV